MTAPQPASTLKNVRTISTLLYWVCAMAIIFQILRRATGLVRTRLG